MDSLDRREAFVALIAPIGVNLNAVQSAIHDSLKQVGYRTNQIRLTSIFDEIDHGYDTTPEDEYDRYVKLIAAGDQLCHDTKRNDIMALYGIHALGKYSPRGDGEALPGDVIHIFRQLKRVDEIRTFKEVFGRNILFLSCFASKNDRINNLVKKLLETKRGTNRSDLESLALKIIALDEDERGKPHGQRVVDCYPHADYVIDCSSHASLTASVERFVQIYFGHPFISPNKDEYCSYFANAASYRSLDLSRQVGAAIFSEECEIIALGCNEVPKSGGGTYWAGTDDDARDFALGRDSNQQVREDMTRDVLVQLQKGDWLRDDLKDHTPSELSKLALEGEHAPLKGSMINDVLENGRMVHAEMNALADAARSRKSTQRATLYCTTMPCHLCTKLIIASGIARVVYLQPYPKSLVEELYTDSVSLESANLDNKVHFETLKGVTPNGFRIAFRKTGRRKNADGSVIAWDPLAATPVFLSHFAYYQQLETKASSDFLEVIKDYLPEELRTM